jgi:hypothetical protein
MINLSKREFNIIHQHTRSKTFGVSDKPSTLQSRHSHASPKRPAAPDPRSPVTRKHKHLTVVLADSIYQLPTSSHIS